MHLFISIQGPQKVKYGKAGLPDTTITAKNIIIATGSVPFVPKGVEVDGKCHLFSQVSSLAATSFSLKLGANVLKFLL